MKLDEVKRGGKTIGYVDVERFTQIIRDEVDGDCAKAIKLARQRLAAMGCSDASLEQRVVARLANC